MSHAFIPAYRLNRRHFLAGTALTGGILISGPAIAVPGKHSPARETILNPVVPQRADAQIFRHSDGIYYMTASVPEYDRLVLRRARSLQGLASAEETVLWHHPATGKLGGYIWAPELHYLDGCWYMYFAAGDAGAVYHIRTYALICDGADPMTGRWRVLGQVETPWDSFTLDSTVFTHRGVRYFCWAQQEPGVTTNSNIYLAPLATPLTIARTPVRLTVPTLPWEVAGYKVNEAPAFLAHGNKVFLTYSAAATDARYCMGLLTADADADLMQPETWHKSPEPVFVTSAITGVYGPGHNAFTTDEEGRDILVYHGRDYEKITGNPLRDPNRHTRIQRIYYRPDGTPDFGIPVGNGPLPVRLSTSKRAVLTTDRPVLCHDGARVYAGVAALAATQWREVPGPGGTITLQPIDAPDMRLMAGADGSATLGPISGPASAPPATACFKRIAGISNAQAASYASVAHPGRYLQISASDVFIRPAKGKAAEHATLYLG